MPPIFFPVFINAETHYYGRKYKNQELSLKSRHIIHLCLLWCWNKFQLHLPPCFCHTLNSGITQHSPPTCLCMKPAVLEISYPGRKEVRGKKICITKQAKTLLSILSLNHNTYIVYISKTMLWSFFVNTSHKILVLIQNFNKQTSSPLFEKVLQ